MYSLQQNPNFSLCVFTRIEMQSVKSFQLQILQKNAKKATKPISYIVSSLAKTPTQTPNTLVFNYLIETLNFSKTEAQSISITTRFSNVKSLENAPCVLHYLRSLGLSETQIRSSVRYLPQILFCDVDKTLKPKVDFFQEMGLVGPDLCKFISSNSRIFSCSLEKKLIPCTQILKKILVNDKNNQDLIRIVRRPSWLITMNPESRFLRNIAFFESCGIVGSQLSYLLKIKPRLFLMEESKLRDLVLRVSDLGLSFHSRMFVYGLCIVFSLNKEIFERKLELLRSFGFTNNEAMEIFRKQPMLFSNSEERLKLALDFFLNKIELKKEMLIRAPFCFTLSLEERVIPRYRVMQILKSRSLLLLNKEPSFFKMLAVSEKTFLEKFVEKFTDDAEELLVAYRGHMLDSSSSSPCSGEINLDAS
ncbi:hypothetical protein ACOSP7_021926 [Xanthoceras sorbifolium]